MSKQRRVQQTRASAHEVAESSDAEPDSRVDDDDGGGAEDQDNAIAPINVMVTRFIRLALASEYARQPIRRAEISAKVLSDFGERNFKNVFKATQEVLADKFAMTLVELPVRERMTVTQRRGGCFALFLPCSIAATGLIETTATNTLLLLLLLLLQQPPKKSSAQPPRPRTGS